MHISLFALTMTLAWSEVGSFLRLVDPKLFYLLVSGAVWGLIYLWRKFSISTWDAVTRQKPWVQTLPALVLSGLLSAAPAIGKDVWTVLQDVILGLVFGGGGSIFLHHVAKAAPIPYNGGKPQPPPAG
jgi:hypothetical protein